MKLTIALRWAAALSLAQAFSLPPAGLGRHPHRTKVVRASNTEPPSPENEENLKRIAQDLRDNSIGAAGIAALAAFGSFGFLDLASKVELAFAAGVAANLAAKQDTPASKLLLGVGGILANATGEVMGVNVAKVKQLPPVGVAAGEEPSLSRLNEAMSATLQAAEPEAVTPQTVAYTKDAAYSKPAVSTESGMKAGAGSTGASDPTSAAPVASQAVAPVAPASSGGTPAKTPAKKKRGPLKSLVLLAVKVGAAVWLVAAASTFAAHFEPLPAGIKQAAAKVSALFFRDSGLFHVSEQVLVKSPFKPSIAKMVDIPLA